MFRIWFERPCPPNYKSLLDGIAEAVSPADSSPQNPLAALPGSHAIIASSRIRYDGAFMDQVPTLLVISRTGIGFDNISLPDATSHGIAICYAPDGPTISTAEHAITLMLAVVKQIKRSENLLRRGEHQDYFSVYSGVEVNGRVLGLVGLGRIGRRVAAMAQAMGMKIAAFDPYVSPAQAAELGIEMKASLEELLRASDIVSIHAPLTPETHHLMNAERFAQLKRGAFFVNAARGGLVDENALLCALESGHLAGAGLDVFDPEPPRPDNPLLHREDVVATPHIAGATGASKDRLWRIALAQALQVLRGEQPPHLLNPESWMRVMQRQTVLAGKKHAA